MKRIKSFVLPVLLTAMLAALLPFGALAASGAGSVLAANEYSDINGFWFSDSAAQYGYTDIFDSGDGCFHPDQAITRMEFVRMLHATLGINIAYFAPIDIGDYFTDVQNTDSGANDLYDLVTCGIIDTTGLFRPADTLDRDEMIHWIMNALFSHMGDDFAMIALAPMPFADDADIKPEYHADVDHAVILQLVNGVGSNYVLPRAAATRAQAVTIADRLVSLLENYDGNVAVKATARESGGGLILTLAIQNNTAKTVTIDHISTQQFDFQLLDKDGGTLYTWSADKMFNTVLTTTEIAPGDQAAFTATISADAYAPIRDSVAGVKAVITGSSSDFTVSPDGYLVTAIL